MPRIDRFVLFTFLHNFSYYIASSPRIFIQNALASRTKEKQKAHVNHQNFLIQLESKMVKTNSRQITMIRWILTLCLVAVLSNPVVGIEFPGLSSFRGLRGASKESQSNDTSEESLFDAISESNSVDEEEKEWELYNNEAEEEEPFEDYFYEGPNDILEDSESDQEERELHGGHGYGYGRRGYNYYGPGYYQTNVYGPYNNYYGHGYGYGYRRYNYNSFVHGHTAGGWGNTPRYGYGGYGYARRGPNYFGDLFI